MPSIKQCNTMQKSCHAMQKPCKKLFSPALTGKYARGECARPSKKNWPRKKKNGKLGKTTTADHGGRGRRRPGSHGGGWCRRAKPAARTGGLRAALARGGQLTRAEQQHYSHLGLRPPSKDFDYNQSQKKLVRSLQGGAPADQAGQGLLPRQVLRVPGHVPVIIRGRRRSGRNAGGLQAQGLVVNELGGATRHPAHLTEKPVAQRVSDPGAPSCSSWTRPTFST